jgi:PadR family transcriptional regulator PadR
MMAELSRHGYHVGAGTLYPMLHELERAGYLTVSTEIVAGKQRKYYRATKEGAAALESAKTKLRELVSEVLHDQQPVRSIRSNQSSAGRLARRPNGKRRGPPP